MAKQKKVSAKLQGMLKKARGKFSEAEPATSNTGANRNVPDGVYTANLVDVFFDEFGKNAVLKMIFKIVDADKKALEVAVDQLVETRFNLTSDEGPSYIKRDFAKFGYDNVDDLLDDVDQTLELFAELIGLNPVCKIMVAMDETDQWQNVYLNDVLEMDEGEAPNEEEAVDEEAEDVPEEEADDGAEGEEEEGELEVGEIIQCLYRKKQHIGEVKEIDDENEVVKVYLKKLKKAVTVSLDKIIILEG